MRALRSKAQWNREILLEEAHKLDPWALVQGMVQNVQKYKNFL
jgi:hypothetical protein